MVAFKPTVSVIITVTKIPVCLKKKFLHREYLFVPKCLLPNTDLGMTNHAFKIQRMLSNTLKSVLLIAGVSCMWATLKNLCNA